jgi:Rhodopirellula transposase DDE domain
MIGLFKNNGRAWREKPKQVNDHDFRTDAASKWNPIEHKLFSEISKNWQGVPLESYETAINYISSTETRPGLRVKAVLNSKNYETGETVTDEEIEMLRTRLHRTLPEWNYTIKPQV